MARYRFALRPKWILSHLFVAGAGRRHGQPRASGSSAGSTRSRTATPGSPPERDRAGRADQCSVAARDPAPFDDGATRSSSAGSTATGTLPSRPAGPGPRPQPRRRAGLVGHDPAGARRRHRPSWSTGAGSPTTGRFDAVPRRTRAAGGRGHRRPGWSARPRPGALRSEGPGDRAPSPTSPGPTSPGSSSRSRAAGARLACSSSSERPRSRAAVPQPGAGAASSTRARTSRTPSSGSSSRTITVVGYPLILRRRAREIERRSEADAEPDRADPDDVPVDGRPEARCRCGAAPVATPT